MSNSFFNTQAKLVRGPLADVSVAYRNQSYIGDRIAPIKDGVPIKASYTEYNLGDWFRDEAKVRAPGANFEFVQMNSSQKNIDPVNYGIADVIPREDFEAAQQMGSVITLDELRQDAVEFIADKIDLNKEVRISKLIKDTTWADGNAAGEDAGGLWAPDDATNTAVSDIRNAIKTIRNSSGIIPNKMILDFGTFETLKDNPRIRDQIKHTSSESITAQLIARFFGFDEVLVGSAMNNTANEGQTASLENIWETNKGKGGAFVFYAPPAMGRRTPSAIGQFRVAQTGGQARLTESYYDPGKRSEVFQTQETTDIVAKGTILGYQFIDTILT